MEEKNKYGTFGNVFLSNTELEELRAKLGAGVLERLVDDLSEHMASTGKSYVSHYATLLRWSKNEFAPKDLYEVVCDSRGSDKASSHIGDTSVKESSSMGQGSGRADSDSGEASAKAGTVGYEKNANAHNGRGVGFGARSDGWDFLNKKGPRDTPREPKNRYGDFDPEEAMRLAIERTMREYGAENIIVSQ